MFCIPKNPLKFELVSNNLSWESSRMKEIIFPAIGLFVKKNLPLLEKTNKFRHVSSILYQKFNFITLATPTPPPLVPPPVDLIPILTLDNFSIFLI